MIYFDNAATSYPKPACVKAAMSHALSCAGANPGRGGYPMAMSASRVLYECRETAADIFGLSDSRRVVLTPGCTYALNTAIRTVLAGGGHVVISDLEHNAVVRPLHATSHRLPPYTVAHVVAGDEDATVANFARAITPKTKAIICTHASNVTGLVLPVERLAALAHANGLPIIVDAAQSAGHMSIRMEEDALDCVCVAGHKGLMGPMGTGLLLCRDTFEPRPLICGGTGSASLSPVQPSELPEALESGTPNVAGIAGLCAAMKWVRAHDRRAIEEQEQRFTCLLYDAASSIRGVTVYSAPPSQMRTAPVVSLCVEGVPAETVADVLARHGIAVRAGLHCAPLAHRAIGALADGTVRFSPGLFTTEEEIQKSMQILKKIATNPLLFH